MKIIQITCGNESEGHEIYGLSDQGDLYVWGYKSFPLPQPDEEGNTTIHLYGWRKMDDDLNNKQHASKV